jgi:hypothetical protein
MYPETKSFLRYIFRPVFTLLFPLLLFHYFFAKPQSPHPYIENIGSIQPQLRDTQKIFADD